VEVLVSAASTAVMIVHLKPVDLEVLLPTHSMFLQVISSESILEIKESMELLRDWVALIQQFSELLMAAMAALLVILEGRDKAVVVALHQS
jgi:hypothetical protein